MSNELQFAYGITGRTVTAQCLDASGAVIGTPSLTEQATPGFYLGDATAGTDSALFFDSAVGGGTQIVGEQDLQVASGLTAQQTRDAMKLAPSGGAAAAGSIDAQLAAIADEIVGPSGLATTITVKTTGGAPLQGVSVWVTSDAAGQSGRRRYLGGLHEEPGDHRSDEQGRIRSVPLT